MCNFITPQRGSRNLPYTWTPLGHQKKVIEVQEDDGIRYKLSRKMTKNII